MPAGRVLLLSMPFSALNYPSIGLSLIKPALEGGGIACDVRYLNLDFAERIGVAAHDLITSSELYQALPGDWVFAPFARVVPEAVLATDLDYFEQVIGRQFQQFHTPRNLLGLLAARAEAAPFLQETAAAIDVDAYDLIGFTSSFQQNAASIGLARLLKQRRPELTIAFGGANCRAELGLELLRRYDFIDAVCIGEGDLCFPLFVRRLVAEGAMPPDVAGMATRGAASADAEGEILTDLDALPIPDFDDFFEQHALTPIAEAYHPPAALFETSRGCWWGAKHHCTFCGINGKSMVYRRKSPERAFAEIEGLVRRHGPDLVNVDAILDTRYFETLLPMLAELETPITAYYELKANLRPDQFDRLARAGILKIQPGIESLDTDILSAMRKGCTAIQNVQTLKLAAEHGLFVEWNFLTGFPGERTDHYERMARLIPHLSHLQPPNAIGRVRADRFSPYFERPAEFGVTITPNAAYPYIYPPADGDVVAMAYHFQIAGGVEADPEAVNRVETLCREWHERGGHDALSYRWAGDGRCILLRRRNDDETIWTELDPVAGAILDAAWTITTVSRLASDLPPLTQPSPPRGEGLSLLPSPLGEEGWVRGEGSPSLALGIVEYVDALEADGLLMREGDQVLALPYRDRLAGTAPGWDEIRLMSETRRAARQAA
jgi:ribosomal peptide maturation radical SAM protein 1